MLHCRVPAVRCNADSELTPARFTPTLQAPPNLVEASHVKQLIAVLEVILDEKPGMQAPQDIAQLLVQLHEAALLAQRNHRVMLQQCREHIKNMHEQSSTASTLRRGSSNGGGWSRSSANGSSGGTASVGGWNASSSSSTRNSMAGLSTHSEGGATGSGCSASGCGGGSSSGIDGSHATPPISEEHATAPSTSNSANSAPVAPKPQTLLSWFGGLRL